MATQQATTTGGSDFLSNLGRIYGFYTGGFVAFVLLLAVLEIIGVPNKILGYLFVFFTLAVYAIIGVLSRTAQVSEYYVAGRSVPAFYNGMATGADWMSAASFVGMAGTLFLLGYDGLAWVLGWTGGFVLVSILIGPYLRKFGAYTVPDFLSFRYGGNFARALGVVVLVACSFTYVTAQIYGTGIIASRFLGMQFEIAVFAGLVGILVCSMLGGMRAVTWTQVAQYIVLIIAYLTPIVILSTKIYGIPIPQLTYGHAIADITAREQEMLANGLAAAASLKPHIQPFINYSPLNFFAIILCMMVGTASLPHILMRYFTTPSVREARQSVAWSLLFIFLLYFSAPAYAAFSKLEVYTNIIGRDLSAIRPWLFNWGELGLIQICGKNAVNIDAVIAACKAVAGHPGVVRLQDFVINTDVIVLSTPEIAGLPYVISGLVAAGGLAAALSTADGLLLAIANALSHDVYYKMIDPNAPTARRLIVARVLLLIVAVVAAATAATKPGDILAMVGWAFSLAMAGNFPALVMGVWWKRTTSTGAVCGIIAGFGLCLFYLVTTRYFPGAGVKYFGMTSLLNPATGAPLVDIAKAMALPNAMESWPTLAHPLANKVGWFNLSNIACGLLGAPFGFAVIIIVSLLGRAPSREMQAYVDEIRKPRGRTVLEEKTT
ncbi:MULTISPECIES: sodium:solute symporter family protein [unclassified Bradyrhizobium]|jgi:cation/acetate symporter|uniref:sodium:solute symporter family protein n=1 Tax=unclassified Bradyrhizobium TaxID=2631580 RepID=UPI001053C723|nr:MULTISPECIES: sodium:solute symporter family protein [unclassified Bradyrhizobium]TCU65445.1 cation/acetate symporter [Bradyrhizobium sp. Y-H1]TCU67592.1 cation/acetate symporter [Bradyrhizobium sp. R2.2-H]UPJ68960.1 cation acetate symporter [Bradyrhizobium sp. 191]